MALKGNPFDKPNSHISLPVAGPRSKPKFEKIELGTVPSSGFTEAVSKKNSNQQKTQPHLPKNLQYGDDSSSNKALAPSDNLPLSEITSSHVQITSNAVTSLGDVQSSNDYSNLHDDRTLSENKSPSDNNSLSEKPTSKTDKEKILADSRVFDPRQSKDSIGVIALHCKAVKFLYTSSLDANEYRLIIFLISETWGRKTTWIDVSGSMASKEIGWDTSQFWRTMKGLRKKSIILSQQLEGSRSNYYSLNPSIFGQRPEIANSVKQSSSDLQSLDDEVSSLYSKDVSLGDEQQKKDNISAEEKRTL